jgi:hypothetical protein
MKLQRHLLIGATLVAALGTAFAQDRTASPDVVRGVVDGLTYRNGGIGRDEALAMTRNEGDYTLRLGFAEGPRNAYLADVKLDIFGSDGRKVFALGEAGPLVDVQLPPGRYRAVAESGGVRRQSTLTVEPKRLTRAYLHWSKDPTA